MKLTNRPLRAQPDALSHDGRPMKYAHGQHAAYVLDKCRCQPCRTSNREYERDRHRRLEPAFVLASEARAHVAWLATQGIGRKQVAKVSGVAHGAICKLMDGDSRRGSPPSKRIRWRTHEAIMAVTPADIGGHLQAIPAGPTWVLLDEMIAAGIPKSTIASALGVGASLQIKHTTVSPANRDKVYALHQRWLAGDWRPARRDSHGGSRPCLPPPSRLITREQRAEAYDNRMTLMGALADALEARVERPWRNQSACRGRPSHMWFPQPGDIKTRDAAVRICNSCPVRRQCLMANLDARDGIYGGLGGRARLQLRAELAEHPDAGVMAREHGTTRGYRDHLLGGEDPCERCKAANARYQREYRADRSRARPHQQPPREPKLLCTPEWLEQEIDHVDTFTQFALAGLTIREQHIEASA